MVASRFETPGNGAKFTSKGSGELAGVYAQVLGAAEALSMSCCQVEVLDNMVLALVGAHCKREQEVLPPTSVPQVSEPDAAMPAHG